MINGEYLVRNLEVDKTNAVRLKVPRKLTLSLGWSFPQSPEPIIPKDHITLLRDKIRPNTNFHINSTMAPKAQKDKYSVLLPTYNERANLGTMCWLLNRTFTEL